MLRSRSLLVVALAACPAPALASEPIEGMWANPERSVTIRVGPCGEAYCGTVVRADQVAQAAAARRGTRLVGSKLLSGLEPRGEHWRGKVFVADHGFTASAKIVMVGSDQMRVQGCALGGMVCRSQTWARVGD